jgi:hypothetical protein
VEAKGLLQKIAALLNIQYVYRDETPEPAAEGASLGALAAQLGSAPGRETAARIREAAEMGQLRRVEELIEAVPDAGLRAGLKAAFEQALAEQDAEAVVAVLDRLDRPPPAAT